MVNDEQSAMNSPIEANKLMLQTKLDAISAKWIKLSEDAGVKFVGGDETFDLVEAGKIHTMILPALLQLRSEALELRKWETDNLQGLRKAPLETRAHGHLAYIEMIMLEAYLALDKKGAIKP